jgi:hypothetical protein
MMWPEDMMNRWWSSSTIHHTIQYNSTLGRWKSVDSQVLEAAARWNEAAEERVSGSVAFTKSVSFLG